MEYTYITICCTYCHGEHSRIGYGIAYVCVADGVVTVLQSVSDISSDRQRVERLVEHCCKLGLDPMHLEDVVEDFMVSE